MISGKTRACSPANFLLGSIVALILLFAEASYALAAQNSLRAYFIDVEGGQATLFVTPTGQSLLIDTGWPGHDGRDADRIVAAARLAGIQKIDYVLLTHYHDDHSGGVPQLVQRIPVGTFIDHGANIETATNDSAEQVWQAYQKVLATGKYQHLVAHPGQTLPISGMQVTVISSDGRVIDHPLSGAGEKNEFCSIPEDKPVDRTENAQSLGVLIQFGKLRILDLGDLTWDKEMQFMCPMNRLGRAEILVVSHHGTLPSSSHALVDAIHARVAIMDNGATKGGQSPVLDTIREAPGLEALWQLHYADLAKEHNTPATYIANPDGPDRGNYILLTAERNGSFSVFNSGNGISKAYKAK
ncbi:MAG: MBL fold metallo-hydrolase [Acidobacteriota bacterium]|nr:MBL fold metallo-hydrolase [Acidobacteriota bacterium]